jgi:hypothetical protein
MDFKNKSNIIEHENSKYKTNRLNTELYSGELIPQFFWGDLTSPNIIILGKNPVYSIDDEIDNRDFSSFLNQNLKTNERDEETVNLLTNLKSKFASSGTSRWWRKSFKGWSDFSDENIKFEDLPLNKRCNFMSEYKIAIFNMYGFYSKSLNSRPNNKSYIIENDFKEELVSIISNAKKIYIMWEASLNWWFGKDGILDLDIHNLANKVEVYIVNGKCKCNCLLKNSVSYIESKKRS